LVADEVDNVGGILGQGSRGSAFDVVLQLVVNVDLVGGDGKDDVDGVLLDLEIDLRDGGVVLNGRVGVHAFVVQVTVSVVGLDNATKLKEGIKSGPSCGLFLFFCTFPSPA
jgi:hypothetical protein